jgi:hypothetical protein
MHLKFEASFWKYEKKKKKMLKEMEVYQFNKYKFYNHFKKWMFIVNLIMIYKKSSSWTNMLILILNFFLKEKTSTWICEEKEKIMIKEVEILKMY